MSTAEPGRAPRRGTARRRTDPEELFAVPQIEVDDRTYRELELLAVAWHTTITEAVDRLVTKLATRATVRAHPATDSVEVHAFYNGTRIDATFDPESHAVTVCSGPLCGRIFKTPDGARRAAITLLTPGYSPNGNGWTFWTVTDTGALLNTLHRRGDRQPMKDHEATAETQVDVIDARTRRLAKAAGAVDEPTNWALAEVARVCGPDTIDALVTLLLRLRMNGPDRLAACPVVAFVRYGAAEGVPPVRGAAITADGAGRYNVHSVFWQENTARWDGSNGRYGVTWAVARDAMNRRADADVAP